MEPWTDQNLSKTNVLKPGVVPGGSASKLAAGGEPSTWFLPGGLVETAGTTSHVLHSRPLLKHQQIR